MSVTTSRRTFLRGAGGATAFTAMGLAGIGPARLRAAGIELVEGVLREEALAQNTGFFAQFNGAKT